MTGVEPLVLAIVVVVVITLASVVSPKLGVAAPLVLVAAGLVVSVLPFTPDPTIDPDLILVGLLPPLLYSSAVNLPAMDFRRDFTMISGFSVVLVIISSLLLGWMFSALFPDVDFALGVAIGAIVSPTDAVATAIVKRQGVSPRVVTVLEGESMLNDASALVLLRSAIAATATTISFWAVLGGFVWAVVAAAVVGAVVGYLSLRVRARIHDDAITTAISFTVPFLAYLPAEHVGGSGLVAAVTAGLVAGHGAPRWLGPTQRLAERLNWRTIEALLEGMVFLLVGLEMSRLIADAEDGGGGVGTAALAAAVTLFVAMVIRSVYVVVVVLYHRRRMRRAGDVRGAIDAWNAKIEHSDHPRADRVRTRLRRASADYDYYDAERLGRREAIVLVWAGLRGAVTVAAAQTLPPDTQHRSSLVLVAFFVAVFSLVVQGGTMSWLVRALGLADRDVGAQQEEWDRLRQLMTDTALRTVDEADLPAAIRARLKARATPPDDEGDDEAAAGAAATAVHLRMAVIDAQRAALLRERDDGTYSAAALKRMLAILDADQISLELRTRDSE